METLRIGFIISPASVRVTGGGASLERGTRKIDPL